MAILERLRVPMRSDAKVDEDFMSDGKPVNDGPTTRDRWVRRAKSFFAAVETHFHLQRVFRPSRATPPGVGQ